MARPSSPPGSRVALYLRRSTESHQEESFDTQRTGEPPSIARHAAGSSSRNEIPELTHDDLASAIPARVRRRLMRGQFESGSDIAALRRFVRLSQPKFAEAMGISVHTLRNWEQDRRRPEGPALARNRSAP
jgi:DNA-binding transcriptional regulator YiaG